MAFPSLLSAQIPVRSGGGSGSASVCTVTGSQTSGYVLTATDNTSACTWQTVGGASVDANTVKNAWYLADSGTANAVTGTTTTTFPGAYATGQAVIFKAAATNTTATTINVNALGPKNLMKGSAGGMAALAAGNKVSAVSYIAQYDGTQFQLIGYTQVAADIPTLNQNTTGTAANLSGTPALPNGTTATTQTQADGTTKLATDAYVDTGLATKAAAGSATTVNSVSCALSSTCTVQVSVASGITGLGTGVATWLATPSSANLLASMTTKTGTGSVAFGTSPSFSAVTLSDITGSTQCLHVSTLGLITGTGSDCGAGSGGASTALDNLASVNINTSLLAQTGVDAGSTAKPFRDLYLWGSGTFGTTSLRLTGTPTAARVWTLPDVTDTFTGLTASQTLTNKTLTTPTIANFTNAAHNHTNAAGGGTLTLTGAAFANQGTTTTILHGNAAGNPSFGAITLTTDVTGVLPAANGGAGTVTGALKSNGSGAVSQAACADLSNAGTACTATTGTSGASVPLLNANNTYSGTASFTGALDASGATHTQPALKGLAGSKPATCTQGEQYFATDATAGQNLYFCTATNTWTQQLNSGGGGSGTVNSGTSGHIGYYATSSTAISSDSNLDDGATTANTLTYAGTGGISSPAFIGTGSTAGLVQLGQGTANTTGTNTIGIQAPASVATSYVLTYPGATPSGGQAISFATPSSGVSTGSWITPMTTSTSVLASQMPAFTGDATTSAGAVATTVAKVNGIAYSSTAAAHSVEVITTANTTATAKVLPDCTDTAGNHLNYTQSTDAFSCGTSSSGGAPASGAVVHTTSYTLTSADNGLLTVMNCSGACTVTLYGSPTSTYAGAIESIGSTVATVSLNSKTFNGASSVPVLNSYRPMSFWSDGTNYFGKAPDVAGTNVTLTPASNGLTIAATGGGSADIFWQTESDNVAGSGTTANATLLWSVYLKNATTFGTIATSLNIATSTDNCDLGIYNSSGTLQAHWGATAITGGVVFQSHAISGGGSVTLNPGWYEVGFTCTSTSQMNVSSALHFNQFSGGSNPTSGNSTSGGALNASVGVPATSRTGLYRIPAVALF